MSDMETLLRSTLAGRAATVGTGPQWVGPSAAAPGPGGGNRRWLAAVAAAAAVVAVGAGAVALRASDPTSHPAGPAPSPQTSVPTGVATSAPTSTPHPSSTHTSSSPTPPANVTELASCATALPGAWTSALQNSVVDLGGRTVMPLTVAPDGSLVALRDDGVAPGSGREVVYAPPNSPGSVVYSIKSPDHTSVQVAQVAGPWLVLGLWNDPRPPRNTEPGSSAVGLQGIVVVNLENLGSTLVAGTDLAVPQPSSAPQIQSVVIDNDHVYWDEESHYGDATGTLRSYALGAGTARDVYTGEIGYLMANPAGVGWVTRNGGFFFAVRNTLPATVEHAMTSFSRPRLRSDGSAYAWIESPKDVYWWQPGSTRPVHLVLPGTGIDTEDYHGYVSVSGHLLISDSATPMVIDMHTGAVAPLPSTGLFGSERGELIANTGPMFYGLAFTGSAGHFENGYWADTAMSALRVNVSKLPDVSC